MAVRSDANSLADDALSGVRSVVIRLVDDVGVAAVAELLRVDRAQVLRWSTGDDGTSAAMDRRILDLHNVLARLSRVYPPELALAWLVGSEPLLGGARPVDALELDGATPVVCAIDAIEQGAYA